MAAALRLCFAFPMVQKLLALLLIGILAIPTLLFVSVIGGLWALADFAIRAIDA